MGAASNGPESSGKRQYGHEWFRFARTESRKGLFWSNLHDFLYERPVKGAPRSNYLKPVDFKNNFRENLSEWFRPGVGRVGNSTMLVEGEPWHRAFVENIKQWYGLARTKPVTLDQPLEVGELWNPPRKYRRTQLLVLLAHVLVAILILVPLFPQIRKPAVQQTSTLVPIDFSPYVPPVAKHGKKLSGGGGGGERKPVPASKGALPKFSTTQFTPPKAKVIPHPLIAMQATVLGPPKIKLPSPNMANYGDPLGKLVTTSNGPGNGAGIGTGNSGGVGSGQGGGVGPGYNYGAGGGYPQAGESGYGEPVCLYCPNPQFSNEAVKVKYQGTVLLRFVVTANGTTKDIQVIRSLGLGLDQKAIAAVRTWKFKPAVGPNGKPAAVIMMAEISYRLL